MRVFHRCTAVIALGCFPLITEAENLLQNASFEQPKIQGRVVELKGGSPSKTETETSWAHFQTMDEGARISVGLSDELSRTGQQSIYVDFVKVAKCKDAFLMSRLLAVKPAEKYRVSIWGRMDPKRPLTLAQARPLLRLEVEFYQADEETQIDDTAYRTQQIPGSPRRVLFESGKWNEYFSVFRAPEYAAYMKITFRWEPPGEEGEADGLIYFDDAVVEKQVDDSSIETAVEQPAAGTPVPPTPAGVPPTVPK